MTILSFYPNNNKNANFRVVFYLIFESTKEEDDDNQNRTPRKRLRFQRPVKKFYHIDSTHNQLHLPLHLSMIVSFMIRHSSQ